MLAAAALTGALTLTACGGGAHRGGLDEDARNYIELVHALAAHEPGTIEWSLEGGGPAGVAPVPLPAVRARAAALAAHLRSRHAGDPSARRRSLLRQADALAARSAQLDGATLTLDEELARLYGLEPPGAAVTTEGLDPERGKDLAALERLLPGTGAPAARLAAFERGFLVPVERLPAVIERAVARCRAETVAHLALPPGESLSIEYVRRRPWSGYARYLGGFETVMQVNVDFPLTIDRAITLACHEGYPGHHVYNSIREQVLLRERGWQEFSVMPTPSPWAFGAEAFATLAAAMALSEADRIALARDELFPLAGLDPAAAALHVRVARHVERLEPRIAAIALAYLRREIDRARAARALEEEALMAQPAATLAFIDRYGAYALAYTAGRARLAREAVDATPDRGARWRALAGMIQATASEGREREARNDQR